MKTKAAKMAARVQVVSFREPAFRGVDMLVKKLAVTTAIGVSLIAQNLCAQSTNGPIISIVKIGSGQSAVLTWTSQTNEIYRIDYTSDLTTNWTTAAENIPNQGTNTVWADAGTESLFYPRPSSSDPGAPIRFYRIAVQAYSSNSFPATITISNVTGGTILSELTNVIVSVSTSSNIDSASLLLDGNEVSFGSGTDYAFPIETRYYANGAHRLTVSVQNDGDNGTTGGDDAVPDPSVSDNEDSQASFATKNASVTFSNFLSDVHVKYKGYRPDLGQTQEVYGVWTEPRNWQVDVTAADDTNTVYRTFTGSGTDILVQWDGLDTNGFDLSPQRIAYVIYDLGPFDGMSLMSMSAETSPAPETPILWAVSAGGSGSAVPLALYPPGIDTNGFTLFEATYSEVFPARSTASKASSSLRGSFSPMDVTTTTNGPFIVYSTYKVLGSFGMLYQGHHPFFGSYPRPPRGLPFGQVTFATGGGFPWGQLKAPKKIASYLAQVMPAAGYSQGFVYGDDAFAAAALQKSSLGGSNILNNVNLGLYVGHSAAGKENIVALAHPQTYIPVYSKASDSFTWIGMNDMSLGSSSLKWAAFYSCNLFRDSAYRANGCYAQMKNNNHLAMKSSLHIMQAYATEVTVQPDMGKFWVVALINGTGVATDSTVLGAWKFVCLNTQPKESAANANVSRSIYWPECAGDHIYGYGSQTNPSGGNIQSADLVEDDQQAHTL